MANRALEVDEQLSWALRHGDTVRVLVRIPGTTLAPSAVVVRLSNGRLDLEVPATVGTVADTLAFEVPQGELGRTAWRMAIQPSSGAPFRQVQARLLAVDGAPVALLPGPVPATRMPAPPVPPAPPSAARRVAAHLPAPARRALRRAAAAGRQAAEHLRDRSR